MNNPLVDIVILNWNNWQDTIDCLRSIQDVSYSRYRIFLIDNGSDNDSVVHLLDWVSSEKKYQFLRSDNPGNPDPSILGQGDKLFFLQVTENLGFAGGSNLGINYSRQNDGDLVLLLNNDTSVTADFLEHLVNGYLSKTEIAVAVPQIRYFDRKDIIWNCGGKVFFGFRKYFFEGKSCESLPDKKYLPVTFFTGCALLFNPDYVGSLTEKFFFGEEDFELALRIKKMGLKAVCMLQSIVYHKVGASINSIDPSRTKNRILVYYLNRFINLKIQWPRYKWQVWRWVYRIYILRVLRKNGFSGSMKKAFLNKLFKLSDSNNEVDKALFHNLMAIEEWN